MSLSKFKLYLQTLTSSTTSIEYLLKKILSIFLREHPASHLHQNMFCGITSKDISKLVSLLEFENPRVRKMTLVILTLVLSHPQAKVTFLEKCGLGLVPGKVFLTRLKYISKDANPFQFFSLLSAKEKKETVEGKSRDFLFWHIPISSLSQDALKKEELGLKLFDERMLKLDEIGELYFETIPDPTRSLCGFELFPSDLEDSVLLLESIEKEENCLELSDPPDYLFAHHKTRDTDTPSPTLTYNSKHFEDELSPKKLAHSLILEPPRKSSIGNVKTKGLVFHSRSPTPVLETTIMKSLKPEVVSKHKYSEDTACSKAYGSKSSVKYLDMLQKNNDQKIKISNCRVPTTLKCSHLKI